MTPLYDRRVAEEQVIERMTWSGRRRFTLILSHQGLGRHERWGYSTDLTQAALPVPAPRHAAPPVAPDQVILMGCIPR
jgi:hypothetical protein